MNKTLEQIFARSVELLKQDSRCLGGWHFGSVSRHKEDEFSDVDPVFLIGDEDFDAFDSEVPNLFQKITKDCILMWPEEFNPNNRRIKNYAVLVKGEDDLIVQYDFTFMNKNAAQKPFCKIFYSGCDESNIIFDRKGDVRELLLSQTEEKAMTVDIGHQIQKYWLYCFLTVKYYKRKDVFKLLNAMQVLFHTHTELLLSAYKKESWGEWPSLIVNNIPAEKQAYLLRYFCEGDICSIRNSLFFVMEAFSQDAIFLCENKGITYDDSLERSVKQYMVKNMGSWN